MRFQPTRHVKLVQLQPDVQRADPDLYQQSVIDLIDISILKFKVGKSNPLRMDLTVVWCEVDLFP